MPSVGATVSIEQAAQLLSVSEREVRARLEPDMPHPELAHRRVRRVLRVEGRLLHVIDPEALRLGWAVQLLLNLDPELALKSGERARRREERAAERRGAAAGAVSAVASALSTLAPSARPPSFVEAQGLERRITLAVQLRSKSQPPKRQKPAKTAAQIEQQRQRWREEYARKEQRRKASGRPSRKRDPKLYSQPTAAAR